MSRPEIALQRGERRTIPMLSRSLIVLSLLVMASAAVFAEQVEGRKDALEFIEQRNTPKSANQ